MKTSVHRYVRLCSGGSDLRFLMIGSILDLLEGGTIIMKWCML